MRVIVYAPDYNAKHALILRSLAEGIPGSEVRSLGDYSPSDVSVIFGVVKRSFSHTHAKQPIIDASNRGESRLIVVESAFILRGKYWNVGWGGINGAANFRVGPKTPSDRWELLRDRGVRTSPWSRCPQGRVVVCGQLPWDTNVQDVDHLGWCRETVQWFQDRGIPVVFRPHPRMHNPDDYGIDRSLWNTEKIRKCIFGARAVVVWNSNSAVDAAIMGVPVIACSPDSIARSIASRRLHDIYRLRCPSRRRWLAGLAYSQWSLDEMAEGLTWRHLNKP